MDVLNVIIQNSALNGMPRWYKATTLSLFATIFVMLSCMFVLLLTHGPYLSITFGY